MATFETIAAATGIQVDEIFQRFDLVGYDPTEQLRDDIAAGFRDALTTTEDPEQEQ